MASPPPPSPPTSWSHHRLQQQQQQQNTDTRTSTTTSTPTPTTPANTNQAASSHPAPPPHTPARPLHQRTRPPNQRRTMPPAGTSQSWTSPAATQAAKLSRLQNNATHLGLSNSPFFPKNPSEYMTHQSEYASDLAEREREKLGVKMGEVESRRKVEGERSEMRGQVERIRREMRGGEGVVGGLRDLKVEEEGGEVAEQGDGEKHEAETELSQLHEEELQEARAGKLKAPEDEVETAVTETETDGAENKEQIEGTEVDSPETGEKSTTTKTEKSRKNHRGKGSKGKSKEEVKEDVTPTTEETKPSTSKATAANKSKNSSDMAKNLAASIANDPLFRGVLAGTAKPPNSSLWKAFTQSPLYNPSGSAAEISALMQQIPKQGYTPVLGAKTEIWAGDEQLKSEGKRDPKTGEHRANWPDLSELKAEGQYRKDAGKERRLPLPRKDLMNRDAVLAQMGDYSKLSEEQIDDRVRELEKKTGEDIPWYDREVIRYKDFDRLESVSKERREDEKRRRTGGPILGPYGPNAGMSAQMGASPGGMGPGYQYGQTYGTSPQNRGGANMGASLRGAFSNTGRGRGQAVPAQPKVVNPEAISYGADGPGDGKKPPPGGWEFDEEFLKQKGEWKDLLEYHL